MLLDDLWNLVKSQPALIISLLSLVIAILALRLNLKQLHATNEQTNVTREAIRIQEQQFRFGKDFARKRRITDGSLQLKFLRVNFTGPNYEDSESAALEFLMPQTAIDADITMENISSSDALVEDICIMPILRSSRKNYGWLAWHIQRRFWSVDSRVVMSLKDHNIVEISGQVGPPWIALRDSDDNFRSRRVWDATIFDIDTGEQLSFNKPLLISHDGRKHVWKLKWSINPDFYETLLNKYRFYFAGIEFFLEMDIGNLFASFDYRNSDYLVYSQ